MSEPIIAYGELGDPVEHFIERINDVALRFRGWTLADISTRRNDETRWVRVRIMRSVKGPYIISSAGMSVVEGERVLERAQVLKHAHEIPDALRRGLSHNGGRLTRPSLDAISAAAQHDAAIAAAMVIDV